MPKQDRPLACYQAHKAFWVCMQDIIKEFGLREAAGAEEQTYALGLKEVWQVSTELSAVCASHTPHILHTA